MKPSSSSSSLRVRLFHIVFESDSRPARAFDIAVISAIVLSVLTIMLDTVASLHERYGVLFFWLEWGFTLLFTFEYLLRIYCLDRPKNYVFSFWGLIDLAALLPSWLSLVLPGGQALLVIRFLRILRIFRVLRLTRFVNEGQLLQGALLRSRHKILLFLFTVLSLVSIFGSIIFLVEPASAGFTSIPRSIYWAVVTLTTVGYGDISPVTPLGQVISSLVMVLGYSILAVPTGVFSAEVMRSIHFERYSDEVCPGCGHEKHEADARFCKLCGTWLDENAPDPRSGGDAAKVPGSNVSAG
ncbi:ion transporter [Halotalea alkalilenta]|uniref:Ion transporter n=1 Tax=Halotalea alkalilenta TaxID=376489 RepID=A0A172YD33_9GAMM|nr:ion transporter [Halotalea alkalilenta]ANF57171.1 ion transporter [Halotalea alkalilenta]